MTSKPVAQLLVDLGVARSHSRPHVSNDNPFSEAAFKTLKYAPVFPGNFGSLADARAFGEEFFSYYNHEHRSLGVEKVWWDVAVRVVEHLCASLLSGVVHVELCPHRRSGGPMTSLVMHLLLIRSGDGRRARHQSRTSLVIASL